MAISKNLFHDLYRILLFFCAGCENCIEQAGKAHIKILAPQRDKGQRYAVLERLADKQSGQPEYTLEKDDEERIMAESGIV